MTVSKYKIILEIRILGEYVEYLIILQDKDGIITYTRHDLLKYTGYSNIIAAALMIRVLDFAINKLNIEETPKRTVFIWKIGFLEDGILDCIEMLTKAVSQNRCVSDTTYHIDEAPRAINGFFTFAVTYKNKTVEIFPSKEIFNQEFLQQVLLWQEKTENTKGKKEYIEFKQNIVNKLLETPSENLFTYKI